jgi:hypothetical protein
MVNPIQRSFTSGEISPAVQARADIVKYATGLNLCENFIVRSQGGVYSRPGFSFKGALDDSDKVGRLIPFSFNTAQTYILVFEHLKIRVMKDGGYVLDGAAIFELATPYTESQLSRLSFTQSADVMTIVHPAHDPRNLSRLDHDDWTLAVISYVSSVTPPTFASIAAVGTGAGTYDKDYSYVVTTVDGDGVESLPSSESSITTSSLSTTAGVRLTWGAISGAEYYRVYKDPSNNTGIYGWVGDSNTTTFDDFNIAPLSSDAPPGDRRPFDGANNKPATVEYYQQRQVFASTNNEPQSVYTTQTNNFKSFRLSTPARDDDAVTFTVAAKRVNEVRHLLSLDSLVLLTSGGEWRVSEGRDEVLTPSSVGVRIQSYNGTSWVKPVIINSTALYLQEKGSRIRDLNYDFNSDGYTGNDLSIMAEHLFDGFTITDMTYTDEPYGILWCVRSDGVLLGLTYLREHQVWGWHRHTTDGLFESVATISEDGRDALYAIVNRTIGGVTKRYVERLEKRESINAEDAFYVDSGLSYDGVPATTFSGLDHLEGEAVDVLADGYAVTGRTVTGGSITLEREASKVHIGLKYTPVIETLDIDTNSPTETLKAQSVSVSKVYIEVEGTRGGFVGAKRDVTSGASTTFQEIKPRFESDGYNAIALKSYKQEVSIDPSWGKGGGIRIEQRSPLPMAILSVIPRVDIGGS